MKVLLVVLVALVATSVAWPHRKRDDEVGQDGKQDKFVKIGETLKNAQNIEDFKEDLKKYSVQDIRDYVQELRKELDGIVEEAWEEGEKIAKMFEDNEIDEDERKTLEDLENKIILEERDEMEYLPPGGEDDPVFIQACIEEFYEIKNSDDYQSIDEAATAVVSGVKTCGTNGVKELEKILDIESLGDDQIKSEELMVPKIRLFARAVREMYDLSRFSMKVWLSTAETPKEFFDELTAEIEGDDDDSTEVESQEGTDSTGTDSEEVDETEPLARRMNIFRKIKARMELRRMLRKLNYKKK